MTLDEQATSLDHKAIVNLLASHQQLTTSFEKTAASLEEQSAKVTELSRQLEWLKRQLFGKKSERRLVDADGRQLTLGDLRQEEAADADDGVVIATHRRKRRKPPWDKAEESGLRFDESVPVEEIRVPNPGLDASLGPGEVISEKTTYRLAQRPGSYVVLKYIRSVVKDKTTGKLTCPPAPASVLGKSYADVSFLAGMVIDKFRYYLPLYRQHQRLQAAGILVGRSTLTSLVQRTANLLQPIYDAQLVSIVNSQVLTMDETPIRAGRKGHGKMKTGYFWPVYGDQDEIAFPFSPSREGAMVREVLGEYCGVLISDGYKVYESYAAQVNGVVHAQCWSHTRRKFLKAEGVEPKLTARALGYIRRLYEEEAQLNKKGLNDAVKTQRRAEKCKPIVDEFFEWLEKVLVKQVILPSNPFAGAVGYAQAREAALRVFLEYPNVPVDTNHLEREIRPIALGRKNWMFCWTELGAANTGLFHSLLATCRMQGLDPYTYLVDVLQRVETHPAIEVEKLTPRLWKGHYAADPMRSDIDPPVKNTVS